MRHLRLALGCLAAATFAAGVAAPAAEAGAPAASTTSPVPYLAAAAAPPGPTCPASAQPAIDAAPDGAEVLLPGCVIRETLHVPRPLIIRGVAGTEIRGSDVWTDWSAVGDRWRSAQALPEMPAHGECRAGTTRCLQPEQVFRDGVALAQVSGDPGPDEFSVDADRHVRLGAAPAGAVLEVGMRPTWIAVESDGVTIEHIAMRHATNDAQTGALSDDGHAIVVRDVALDEAHGANVWLTGRSELLDSEIAYAGQLGIGVGGARVAGNRVHDNGTEDFDPQWEAGGFKAVNRDVTVEDNEFDHNAGPGIWFDIGSSGLVVRNNRVHANRNVGIYIEISTDARVSGNSVWDNGTENDGWMGGSGILVHSSTRVEVDHNLVAWNGDGIGVASQDRSDRPPGAATQVSVHDNTIWMTDGPDTRISLGWVEDWDGPLFDSGSGNTGERNRFWYPAPEGGDPRFVWSVPIRDIGPFSATPGGRESSYLSDQDSLALLREHEIPLAPASDAPSRSGAPDPPSADATPGWIGGALVAALVAFGLAAWLAARRRTGAA